MATKDAAFDATLAAEPSPPPTARGSATLLGLTARSTVLPRLVPTGTGTAERSSSSQRFEPVRVLGKGGLGEVTLVQDHDIDRPVALKRLHSDQQTEERLYRFAQEIRTVGQLEHPNIAPVYDVGIDDAGQHYFVMRYVEGETLEGLIAKLAAGDPDYHRRYTFERRVELFLGVLHAIQYAHGRQIIHRDIKPANIMLGAYGEVLMMDWGIAKKRGQVELAGATEGEAADAQEAMFRTRSGSLVGTPAYMSPEQASGAIEQIDERSDVYSLAVLFYELLALRHYLPGCTNLPELLSSIVDGDHVPASFVPNAYQSPVPAELGWFVEKGLAKDPAQRFQSVTEMIDELHRVIAGDFKVQCPVTFMKRVGRSGVRFTDRHPAVSMIGLVTLVASVGFSVFELVRALL